ncbi:endo-beta-N-acetylglucosaminidase [Actinoplanes rectilineatus]|uniref:endo-beta-N-acetylglucosaminidase n=1 Tax=Actinoplanes rectilineatus TaxID=113571 RepID=UPI0007C7CFF4|nr:endo-beta-N-acetylglucosaminidase [Actinoplanes rectilineatus]
MSRRRTTAVAAAATALLLTAAPLPARASDTLPWTGDAAKGANQPYQHGYSTADLLRWTPESDLFGELLRSRVPLEKRVSPQSATQQHPALDPAVENLTLAGDYGNAFFESYQYNNEFSAYLFNFWQYTDYYASWHGMPVEGVPEEMYDPTADWREKWFEFGMLNLPNAGYTNAAHRNGVKSLGTIFFSENDRGTQTYTELLKQDASGDYPVARKLIELARWYGFDGYFINQEEPSVAVADIPRYKQFLKVIKDAGLYVQFYDSVHDTTGARTYQNAFNSLNSPFVRDPQLGDVSDSMFLNYWWNRSRLTSSAAHAKSIGLDPRKVSFAGVEAGMYQFEQPYDLRDNLDANGVPMNAIATLGADFVHADMANKEDDAEQWRAYDRERRWWTGSTTGSATDDAAGWKGIDSYITERSTIGGTVFDTTFNTGHGLEWREKGVISDRAEWSNINVQDKPVTWQWNNTGTLGVDYDYGPDYVKADRFDYQQIGGYQGGSSLVIQGDLTGRNHLKLYRTELRVDTKSTIDLTYRKVSPTDASTVSAALTFTDDPSTVVTIPVPDSGVQTAGWTTATLDLGAHRGRTIATVGLDVDGATVDDYQVNIGRLTVNDGRKHTPGKPTGLHIRGALTASDELELGWDLAPYDEVAEYAVYDDGRYLGGVYDDVLYVKHFTAGKAETKGTLELRAIGHDGSVSKPQRLDYDFTRGPGAVTATAAADGTLTVKWRNAGKGTTVDGVAVPDTATEAVLTGRPTDGGHYQVTVEAAKGTPVAFRGEYADTTVEPYPADLVAISGNRYTFHTPATKDWYKLYVEEDGVAKTFATTYSSGAKPYIIRGRTTTVALTVTPVSTTSRLTVTIEDYSGNKATTVIR